MSLLPCKGKLRDCPVGYICCGRAALTLYSPSLLLLCCGGFCIEDELILPTEEAFCGFLSLFPIVVFPPAPPPPMAYSVTAFPFDLLFICVTPDMTLSPGDQSFQSALQVLLWSATVDARESLNVGPSPLRNFPKSPSLLLLLRCFFSEF